MLMVEQDSEGEAGEETGEEGGEEAVLDNCSVFNLCLPCLFIASGNCSYAYGHVIVQAFFLKPLCYLCSLSILPTHLIQHCSHFPFPFLILLPTALHSFSAELAII